MGMDWHSSGITTSVVGALKRGLHPVSDELGIWVCGGRGKHSRKTPAELTELSERKSLAGDALVRASRLVAKVDNAAVQDGFQLYLHSFIVSADGEWVVVQQGMRPERKQARRYHWLSEGLKSFVDDPHQAIEGPGQGDIVNLADRRAKRNREGQLALLARGPDSVLRALDPNPVQGSLFEPSPHLVMPARHEVRPEDIVPRRLAGTLAVVADRGPVDFPDLLLTPGVGPRTVRALALASEVVHGGPSRFSDPARFSVAHGGKDGHPFPVPLKVYDETIRVFRHAVDRARELGQDDRLAAIRALDSHARRLESVAEPPDVEALFQEERQASPDLDGRVASHR
jgi:hypothetical protein